jgi:hypothetical protein
MPAQQRGRFGTVRKLPSDRYQVRYYGPDGRRHSAPQIFERKADATKYLALVEAKSPGMNGPILTAAGYFSAITRTNGSASRPDSAHRPSSCTAVYSTNTWGRS